MLGTMPRKLKTGTKPSRPVGTQDFFTRLPDEDANKFRGHVEKMEPKSSVSAVLAMLVRQFNREKDAGGK